MAERVKRSMGTSNWARIPTELLELILSKMSTPTRICVSSVCFPWRRIAKNYFRSPLVSQVPVLMLQEQRKNKKIDCIRLYSLQDRRIYNFPNVLNDLSGSHCVGSSHGWLILQDEMAKPYLLNIFSETHIQLPLPPNEPVVDTESISDIQFDSANPYSWAHDYFRNWILIEKAILSANPSHSNNYAVMIIYGRQSRLGFFNNRDSEWTDLRGNIKIYQDIYCSDNNILYTLGYIKGSIEVWDFKNSPVPIKTVSITQSDFLHAMSGPSIASFSDSHGYLVKSSGEVLLVIRDQTSLFYHVKPRVKPGQSYAFEVYRLDFENETWSQVECLNDCVLFLGEKQHSVSVPASEFPGYKGNLICFSDDSCNVVVNSEYLDREDYEYDREDYNGEDRPVQVFHDDDGSQPYWNREDYNWEDRSVQLFHDDDGSQMLKFKCPPLWVVPT